MTENDIIAEYINQNYPLEVDIMDDLVDRIAQNLIDRGDYVSVVRCKNCKFWIRSTASEIFLRRFGQCHHDEFLSGDYGFAPHEDHFCSYGERREDG